MMEEELDELMEYSPRMGQGNHAVDDDGNEIVIEDLMVSIVDGGVYYSYTDQDTRNQITFQAKTIDRNYELKETGDQ